MTADAQAGSWCRLCTTPNRTTCPAGRHWGSRRAERGKDRRTEENRLLNIKQHFVNVKAQSDSMKPIALNRSIGSPGIRDVNRVWEMFYPGQSFSVQPVRSNNRTVISTCFSSGPNLPRVSVDLMSSGQIELLTLPAA